MIKTSYLGREELTKWGAIGSAGVFMYDHTKISEFIPYGKPFQATSSLEKLHSGLLTGKTEILGMI